MPNAPYHAIIHHALAHSGKAMATTSASTAFSFLANATSSFPAVYTFGVFCACLIVCNFVSVCFMWPCAVATYDYYCNGSNKWWWIKSRENWGYFKSDVPRSKHESDWTQKQKDSKIVKSKEEEEESDEFDNISSGNLGDEEKKDVEDDSSGVEMRTSSVNDVEVGKNLKTDKQVHPANQRQPSQEAHAQVDPGFLELFFRDHYYPFIHRFGKVILGAFGVLLIVYIVSAAQLEPDPNTPRLFPDDDNYIIFSDEKSELFAREDNPRRVKVQIPFGIEHLDQDNCGGYECDATIFDDYGTVIFEEGSSITEQPYAQKFLLDVCEDMEFGSDATTKRLVYQSDSIITTPIKCVFQSFQSWCRETDCCTQTFSELDDDQYICDEGQFEDAFVVFLASPQSTSDPDYVAGQTNYDAWSDYVFAEDVYGTTVPRFFIIEASLTVDVSYSYEDGIKLYKNWKNWLESWTAAQTTSAYDNLDSDFLSSGLFHSLYFKV